ncbi:LLM class flavin-dependent oxidoreductase [Sphingomonas abietis]|uniref:LLM class flavin-dependent oxidoreductase n=1 Tax=Sphingomonas abietis TaxID=3012344 RepID=A0ABY7NLP9_9SPHN|nr:LLM class flavin-dependent oxidoreductase [Sphingomonas abietis]WBO21553.1 LLM class flavin-dependent oxidoreductase [Sphingomonas abietis]
MTARKPILLNGFKQATVGHTAIGLWRHPDSQAHRYNQLDYWLDTARTLEEGGFSGLFIADVLGVLDVYQGRIDATLRAGIQTPSIDPLVLVSAMAAVTSRLGFAITLSTSYEQPYLLARRLASLDHLTGGRIGWNIVTSALDSAARNLGRDRQHSHADRYQIAEEYMEVVYKLWEGSWEDDAVGRDVGGNLFADPAKVHAIGHKGANFSVPSAFLVEPSPQRTPVLFQAGSSEAGRGFAAAHAEGVFLVSPDTGSLRETIEDVRDRAAGRGRGADAIRFFPLATVIVAETDAAAQAQLDDYRCYIDAEAVIARHSAIIQHDLSTADLDRPLARVDTDGIRGVIEETTRGPIETRPTLRQFAETIGITGGGLIVAGSAKTVADALEGWIEESGADGFNIPGVMPCRTFPDFTRLLTPELQRRGRLMAIGGPAHSGNNSLAPARHAFPPNIQRRFGAENHRCEKSG